MSKINWDEAPEWANCAVKNKTTGIVQFANKINSGYFRGDDNGSQFIMGDNAWSVIESRPEEKSAEQTSVGIGMKYDGDKPMYNLLPSNAINSMAQVLTFGAKKYAPNSWQSVPDGLERYRAALLRHTFAIQRGEYLDSESGLPHSAHALCCAAFINELEIMERQNEI